MTNFCKHFVMLLFAFLLGCGNKGPLYLPDAEPVMQSAERPDETQEPQNSNEQ